MTTNYYQRNRKTPKRSTSKKDIKIFLKKKKKFVNIIVNVKKVIQRSKARS